jgi:hypothetical protein
VVSQVDTIGIFIEKKADVKSFIALQHKLLRKGVVPVNRLEFAGRLQ